MLAAFAEHMKSDDLEHLAVLLLAPCHFELEAKGETTGGNATSPAH
jgi:hypothetical protein